MEAQETITSGRSRGLKTGLEGLRGGPATDLILKIDVSEDAEVREEEGQEEIEFHRDQSERPTKVQ
jgi:hypothetical protein